MSDGRSKEGKALRVMEANLTTFEIGNRSCIGRNLALVTVHKYITQFVHRYNATLLNKKEPWRTKSQWFSFQANFWVNLEQRTS